MGAPVEVTAATILLTFWDTNVFSILAIESIYTDATLY